MLDPATPTRNPVLSAAPPPAASESPAPSETPPDLLLIERSRGGDGRAVETLIRRYARRLYRVAWSVVLDDEQSEAAVLETCQSAFGDLSRFEAPGRFSAWLTRLAYNQARALRAAVRVGHAPIAAGPDPAAGDREASERSELERAVAALPEAFRTVYILRVIEGISGSETAASLGLHQTTVRTRLYRAHRRVDPGLALRLRNAAGLLEPSEQCVERMVRRAPPRPVHGSMLTSSASSP